MTFRRHDYDKAHRCPSWSGGGLRSTYYDTKPDDWDAKFNEDGGHPFESSNSRRRHWWQQRHLPCNEGFVWTVAVSGDPWRSWRWGRCSGCDLKLFPRVTRCFDYTWWRWKISFFFRYKCFREVAWIWRDRHKWPMGYELKRWFRWEFIDPIRHKKDWFKDLYRWYRYPDQRRAAWAETKQRYGVS